VAGTEIDGPSGLTWPPQATSHELTLAGERVHHLDFGGPPDGPVVVCVHGLGGSCLNFGVLGPLLARTHRVLALDLVGHGRSAPGDPRLDGAGTLAGLVGQVERFVREVAGGPVELVGHSLGGVVAMQVALRSPSEIRHLVLLDPPVPNRTRSARDRKLVLRLAVLRAPGVRRLVERRILGSTPEDLVRHQIDDATPHLANVPADAVAASVAETRLRAAAAGYRDALRVQWNAILGTVDLLSRSAELAARLDGLRPSTLWLHGEDDKLSPIGDARALAGTRTGWTFDSRPGVGHLPHLEDPDWVAGRVLAWLAVDGGH
jgi:pimeloyl-ACP methyl ester carboxylesterase